jgi:hypothetical protein
MNVDFDSLAERVLGAVFEVPNRLGSGFIEKFTSVLFSENSAFVASAPPPRFPLQSPAVHCVGEYFADILVEDVLVVGLSVSGT